MSLSEDQLFKLLYENLEAEEVGGIPVYEAALACLRNEDVLREWELYLEETRQPLERVGDAQPEFGVANPNTEAPLEKVARLGA
jgi:hypothetical protein